MNATILKMQQLEDQVEAYPKRNKKNRPPQQKLDNLSVKPIKPLTQAQHQMIESYIQGLHIVADGSPGTGKSFIAAYLALKDLFARNKNKIVIVRSAVPTRDLGALPGNLGEKLEVYQIPYRYIFNDLCDNGTAWDTLTKKGLVEFMSTSYIRGITLDDCVLIFDEWQSATWHEIFSVLSRAGKNCQIVLCGDIKQSDLNPKKENSGYHRTMAVISKLPNWFDVVNFTYNDIVRSDFVKSLIIATEETEDYKLPQTK